MSTNPYQPPATDSGSDFVDDLEGEVELAGRFTRFAAAVVDGLLVGGILIAVYFFTGFFDRLLNQQVQGLELLIPAFAPVLLMLVLNGTLLATRGQTIGKLLGKIQIVDVDTDQLLPFWRVYVVRNLWLLPLSVLVILVPGETDDLIVNVVILIDALLIFGVSRRCLHDLLAGSKVVLYAPDRQRRRDGDDVFEADWGENS